MRKGDDTRAGQSGGGVARLQVEIACERRNGSGIEATFPSPNPGDASNPRGNHPAFLPGEPGHGPELHPPSKAARLPEMDPTETLPPELERFWRTDDGLTARERAEAYGIDLSLLEANLALTPEERLRQNDRVLNEALALQAALARSRARTRPPQ